MGPISRLFPSPSSRQSFWTFHFPRQTVPEVSLLPFLHPVSSRKHQCYMQTPDLGLNPFAAYKSSSHRDVGMWHLGTQLDGGLGSSGLTAGFDDLRWLLQPVIPLVSTKGSAPRAPAHYSGHSFICLPGSVSCTSWAKCVDFLSAQTQTDCSVLETRCLSNMS